MKVRTNVKAGGLRPNHNETLVRPRPQPTSLKVKTGVKAGGVLNPSETMPRD